MATPITATPDELVFLRGVYGMKDTSDPSQDKVLLWTGDTGAGNVPSDPGFYTDLAKYAQQLGIDPRDLLAVIASESNYKTSTIGPAFVPTSGPYAGHDVTPRGLIGFTVANVPTVMSWEEWDALPGLSQREQLAYVYKVLRANQQRIGRPYLNAFEVYLSIAAPAHLDADSTKYAASNTLYSGNDWLTNLVIDSWPTNFQRQAMLRGEVPLMNQNPQAYAQALASQGLLHGKVTFGDLSNYLDRMGGTDPNGAGWAGNTGRWALAWNLAFRRFLGIMQMHVPKSLPAESTTRPRYTSFVPAATFVSAPGSAYSFDSSIPTSPYATAPYAPYIPPKKDEPPVSTGMIEMFIVAGLLVGGLAAYLHLRK